MYEVKATYNFDNIPQELKNLRQWVLWDQNKILKTVRNTNADTSDSKTWNTFEAVVETLEAQAGKFHGIGFVFTVNDPYVGIDIDKIDTKPSELKDSVLETFNSYVEYSPSMSGCHIIIKGFVPKGMKRQGIEIYHSGRYFTFTGDIPEGCENRTIVDYNEDVQALFEHLEREGRPQVSENKVETKCDDLNFIQLIKLCKNGRYGTKFVKESGENWRECLTKNGGEFPSRSEIVQSLLNIITYYTREQGKAFNLFRTTAIAKSYDEYEIEHKFKYAFNKALSDYQGSYEDELKQDAKIENDCANFKRALAAREKPAECPQIEEGRVAPENVFSRPPGLLGEIMDQVLAMSPRPVPEISLTAAIFFMSSVCGYAYNVNGGGLNQFIILLAKTATGKDAIGTGVNKIIAAISKEQPEAIKFIGKKDYASAQALNNAFDDSISIGSLFGEFGIKMAKYKEGSIDKNGPQIRAALLELYLSSGRGKIWKGTAYSKKENTTKDVNGPSLTICAESTQQEFYKNLDESIVKDGFMPRFTIIEYTGDRVAENKDHWKHQLPLPFLNKIKNLVSQCLSIQSSGKIIDVLFDEDANKLDGEFNEYCDNEIRQTTKDVNRAIWSRARHCSIKLAANVAVGIDFEQPTIDMYVLYWAQKIIVHTAESLINKFQNNEFGRNANDDESSSYVKTKLVCKIMLALVNGNYKDESTLSLAAEGIVNFSKLNNVLSNKGDFKDLDNSKRKLEIETILETMEGLGYVKLIRKKDTCADKTKKLFERLKFEFGDKTILIQILKKQQIEAEAGA